METRYKLYCLVDVFVINVDVIGNKWSTSLCKNNKKNGGLQPLFSIISCDAK